MTTRSPAIPVLVRRVRRGPGWSAYLYLLPAIILVVGVVHVGIVANLGYSTLDWNGISTDADGVGLNNYGRLLGDSIFWTALRNTGVFALATISIQALLGFLLAILVRTHARLRGVLRTLAFVPVVIAPAVVATSFRFLLTPGGTFNQLLSALLPGAVGHAWLADPRTALGALIAINVWQFIGYSFLIYDAALGQVDRSVIEASRIDGAGTRQLLTRIIAPLLRGSHLVLIVLGAISSLKLFDLVILTTAGGPGSSTQVLTTYIFRQTVEQFQAGYGATLSVVLVLIAMIFAALHVRFTSKEAS